MNASEAQKFKPLPLRKAFDYAGKISEWIAPNCLQIEPVDEIRRHCSTCHEIELLTIPRFKDGKHLLFEFLDEYVQQSKGKSRWEHPSGALGLSGGKPPLEAFNARLFLQRCTLRSAERTSWGIRQPMRFDAFEAETFLRTRLTCQSSLPFLISRSITEIPARPKGTTQPKGVIMRTTALFFLIAAFLSIPSHADWSFYEESTLKGRVSGTVRKDHLFLLASGSIYQVKDFTIQVVVVVMPEVTVLMDGNDFKLVIDGFDEPLICKQLAPPTAKIDATATVANRKKTEPRTVSFDMRLEDFLPQEIQKETGVDKLSKDQQEKLRHHLNQLCTAAFELGLRQNVTNKAEQASIVETETAILKKGANVIESTIDGEFTGFEGETILKLSNGQIWKQSEYHYHYHYAYRPEILIVNDGSGFVAKVEGIEKPVGVVRLK